jgi:NTE family protein
VKIGIALAGGGAKGAAHLGIIQALEENGIKANMYAGTSAGSIVATAKAIGYGNKLALQMLNEISDHLIDINYWGILRALPFKFRSLEAILKGKELKKFLEGHFDSYMSSVLYPLAIVSSDLRTGSQIIFSSQDIPVDPKMDNLLKVYGNTFHAKLKDIIYASAAIPGIFPPFLFDDCKLVDGSVVNVLPANVLSAMGAEKIIAIDLNSQIRPREINGILSVMSRSVNMMIQQNTDLSLYYANHHIVLSPDVSSIGLMEFNRVREAHTIGYEYGNKMANKVYEFLYEDT